MNVRLATQLFSNNVPDAVMYCGKNGKNESKYSYNWEDVILYSMFYFNTIVF